MKQIFRLLCGVIALGSVSCSKNSPVFDPTPRGVYAVGLQNGNGVYWINGASHSLSTQEAVASPHAIAISGNDIYIAGELTPNGSFSSTYPVLWKNGVSTPLTDNSVQAGQAKAVSVVNTDVFVAGQKGLFAAFWQNGISTSLPGPSGEFGQANAIFVAGSDVYTAGSTVNVAANGNAPTYWKGSVATNLTTGTHTGLASAVVVIGANVYVGGKLDSSACYWLNNQLNILSSDGNAQVNSLAVEGTDVYAAGTIALGGITFAAYWKNKVLSFLPVPSGAFGTANSIRVVGSDVYIGGYTISSDQKYTATYWKNGVINTLGGASTTGLKSTIDGIALN